MKIKEIRKIAETKIKEKERNEFVSKYIDLLNMKTQTEKQLKEINKSIKKFERNPEEFCDENDNCW